ANAMHAHAQGSPVAEPPNYQSLRYNEDYRYLRDPARRTEFWDQLKYISLGADPNSYLSFGGELRERVEDYVSPQFGIAGARPNAYLLHRFLVSGDLHITENFRAFVQLGDE